jgi:hypothetical protein
MLFAPSNIMYKSDPVDLVGASTGLPPTPSSSSYSCHIMVPSLDHLFILLLLLPLFLDEVYIVIYIPRTISKSRLIDEDLEKKKEAIAEKLIEHFSVHFKDDPNLHEVLSVLRDKVSAGHALDAYPLSQLLVMEIKSAVKRWTESKFVTSLDSDIMSQTIFTCILHAYTELLQEAVEALPSLLRAMAIDQITENLEKIKPKTADDELR